MKKSHAKEYLKTYAMRKEKWLIDLIENVISANGKPTEVEKKQLFNPLLKEKGLSEDSSPARMDEKKPEGETESDDEKSTGNRLIFKKITHVRGVNALMNNQSIDFSNSCTGNL